MRCVTLFCLGSLIILLASCVAQPPATALRPASTRPLEQQLKAQDRQIEKLVTETQQLSITVGANQNELSALRNEVQLLKNNKQQQTPITPRRTEGPDRGINSQLKQQSTPSQPSATELYLSGFSAYTSGDYPPAVDNFSSFIRSYPRNPYIPNAYYWLGETYLAQDKRQIAIEVFSALVNDYPKASKAADAQLKLAQIYAQLNQPQQAMAALLTLRQQYPDSTASKNIPVDLLDSLSH